MRVGTPGFVSGRLTEAREARRIPSMSALARLLGVNASSVSRWEEGVSAPDADALVAITEALGVRQGHFLRPQSISGRPTFFRSLSNTLVRDLAYQHVQMRWLQEISAVVQHYVELPVIDIPDVLAGASYHQLRSEDIERIALELRRHWKIGDGPCCDVVRLMERAGFVVGSIEMGTTKLDGLCNWSPVGDRPHVLLATDKMSFPRRQMDAAHELSHAILHRDVTAEEFKRDLKLIETQAFRLASAFLMPSTTYPLEIRQASLMQLMNLKERWRVSVKAQIKRLSDLKLIDEAFVVHLYKFYSAKGWTKGEPMDNQWEIQEPRVLSDALHLIVDSGVRSKADLMAVEFTMSKGDVENLCNLPAGWFGRETAKIVTLKPSMVSFRPEEHKPAEIVPFNRRDR
jgi:Zn-dependent peptidase ImmA (M78 family)/transcriptional regulator with XRE-family HTH domain